MANVIPAADADGSSQQGAEPRTLLRAVRAAVRSIDLAIDFAGRLASMIVYLLMALLVTEVIMRYVFDSPTSFATEMSALLFSVMFLIGGAYALRWRSHVNVDIVVKSLSRRKKAALDLVSSLALYLFVGVLFVKSVPFAIDSVRTFERSASPIALYIWPVKVFLSVGAALMLLTAISITVKDLVLLVTGTPLFADEVEKGFIDE
jgi:TRAP-type mannitol/chloroaromatic compound transport system permease small subunit